MGVGLFYTLSFPREWAYFILSAFLESGPILYSQPSSRVGRVYTPGCHESLGYDKGGRYSMGVERCLYGGSSGDGGMEHRSKEEEPCGRDILQNLRSLFSKESTAAKDGYKSEQKIVEDTPR